MVFCQFKPIRYKEITQTILENIVASIVLTVTVKHKEPHSCDATHLHTEDHGVIDTQTSFPTQNLLRCIKGNQYS